MEHLLTAISDFRTAFSIQARIKNNEVTRIRQNVNMFGFSEYDDNAVANNIKTLYMLITTNVYLKM